MFFGANRLSFHGDNKRTGATITNMAVRACSLAYSRISVDVNQVDVNEIDRSIKKGNRLINRDGSGRYMHVRVCMYVCVSGQSGA